MLSWRISLIFRLLWDFESPMTNMHVYVIFEEVWCVVFWVAMLSHLFLLVNILEKTIGITHLTWHVLSWPISLIFRLLWDFESPMTNMHVYVIFEKVWCVVFWVAMFLSFSIGKYIRKDHQTSPISPDMCYLDPFLSFSDLLWDFESPMTNMHVYVIFERGLMRSLLSGYVLIFFYW